MVLDYKTMQNLNTISSFTETLSQNGHNVTPSGGGYRHPQRCGRAGHGCALSLSDTDRLARIMRVTCTDGTPIAITRNYLPYALVDGIETYALPAAIAVCPVARAVFYQHRNGP